MILVKPSLLSFSSKIQPTESVKVKNENYCTS